MRNPRSIVLCGREVECIPNCPRLWGTNTVICIITYLLFNIIDLAEVYPLQLIRCKSKPKENILRSEPLEVRAKSSKNLLLIDDDHDIRDLLATVLRSEGYAVETAANGHEGLSKLRSGFTGIVIVDFMMPVMNGEEFLEALKDDPALKAIPVMMISASATEENARHARQFIPKPFDIHFLLASLAQHAR